MQPLPQGTTSPTVDPDFVSPATWLSLHNHRPWLRMWSIAHALYAASFVVYMVAVVMVFGSPGPGEMLIGALALVPMFAQAAYAVLSWRAARHLTPEAPSQDTVDLALDRLASLWTHSVWLLLLVAAVSLASTAVLALP